jgi:trehalose 2-sulfotransferase
MRSYLVCATPRSGSTLLCELLKDTGVAGRPEEYFEARSETGLPPHPGDYLDDLPRTGVGIRDNRTPPRAPEHSSLVGLTDYRAHLARTFASGTGSNGVFGAKLMWRHLPDFQRLAGRLPEFADLDLHTLLARVFDDPRYVWVTREDKLRQAVSLWRALQTRAWRQEETSAGGGGPRYSFEGIDHLIRSLRAEDDAWQEFFDQHRVDVLRITYQADLEEHRDASVQRVLAHVGAQAPPGWHAAEVMQRQADALSDEWVAAYHRDAVRRGEHSGSAALSAR